MRTSLLASSLVAAVAVVGAGPSGAATSALSCATVRAAARGATAEEVMALFIRAAALNVRPGCAYDLVTPNVRKGHSRASFSAGTAPIARYRTRFPGKVQAELYPRVRLADQIGSWVTLDGPDGPPHTYEIVLRKRQGRWLVDYWARAVGFT